MNNVFAVVLVAAVVANSVEAARDHASSQEPAKTPADRFSNGVAAWLPPMQKASWEREQTTGR